MAQHSKKHSTRTRNGYSGKTWNILGQVYFPKEGRTPPSLFENNSDLGTRCPAIFIPTRTKFILVQDGCWT